GVGVKDRDDLRLCIPIGDVILDELHVEDRGRQVPFELQGADTEHHLHVRQFYRNINVKQFFLSDHFQAPSVGRCDFVLECEGRIRVVSNGAKVSHTFVDKSGEVIAVDDELPPLRVEGYGWFCRHGLVARFSLLFRLATLLRLATSLSLECLSLVLLLTGLPWPGMKIVSSATRARLASVALIVPSMLPPVE